ncbi:MAG: UvrD-helicase domain-containing protein [Spirochaetaceae bacterium]|jgi:ATP-dependent helicase/nuclease subunit A|nr:UvrD-helicase domain-containing protein [Spirochaetaceae bacterium]
MTPNEVPGIINPASDLDTQQKEAVCARENLVVTAGAGSGKTKVLASRFAYLVINENYKVDEILTMTFTNKAVNEMSERIYKTLSEYKNNNNAVNAVKDFNKSSITTFDSFCAGIARIAASRYGIASDFKIDDGAAQELAYNLSVPFVLKNRDVYALQTLVAQKNITAVAKELFADLVLNPANTITEPFTPDAYFKKQIDAITDQWQKSLSIAKETITNINNCFCNIDNSQKGLKFYCALKETVKTDVIYPQDILNNTNKEELFKFLKLIIDFSNIRRPGRISNIELVLIKDLLGTLKTELPVIISTVNTFFQFENINQIFMLINEFTKTFNLQKRKRGILTFSDVASLALRALKDFPDIRGMYKRKYQAIMCDEFQDNNSLQKNMLFLLAEDISRTECTIPNTNELVNGKLFLVGDEKQSVYRFRGADVSVFRSLTKEITNNINLAYNYRSHPDLIDSFNFIFGGLRPQKNTQPFEGVFLHNDKDTPIYEAVYSRLYSKEVSLHNTTSPLSICFLLEDDNGKDIEDGVEDKKAFTNTQEAQAAYIAKTILSMVANEEKIRVRKDKTIMERPCTYNDFAILMRSRTHQTSVEKQFKLFNIPYNTELPAGLFTDAVVNDMLFLIRLIVYPNDAMSYAAVLKSPFVRLSDDALLVCLLNFGNGKNAEPFDERLDAEIPAGEIELYKNARQFYNEIKSLSFQLNTQQLITRLWEDYGYRYETIWSGDVQIYSELYDYLFEIAKLSDDSGKNLSQFIDFASSLAQKPLSIDVCLERKNGVSIMSIHKSKGLEFPVVFVFDIKSKGQVSKNDKLIYFSSEYGPCINLPLSEVLEEAPEIYNAIIDKPENYFFKKAKLEEQKMETAELRRLLYVALTRAETKLFITAALPKITLEEAKKNPLNEQLDFNQKLEQRLISLYDRYIEKQQKTYTVPSFFEILLPVLLNPEHENYCSFLQIDILKLSAKKNVSTSIKEKAAQAYPFYTNIENKDTLETNTFYVDASKFSESLITPEEIPVKDNTEDALSVLLSKAKIQHADFGTVVHCVMEALTAKNAFKLPLNLQYLSKNEYYPQILQIANDISNIFFSCELGEKYKESFFKETEYGFLKLLRQNNNNIYVQGQIDLLFAHNNILYIVDYKTDKIENTKKHKVQLALYKSACEDMFPEYKSIKTYLFYARTGICENMDAEIASVSIKELTENYCKLYCT